MQTQRDPSVEKWLGRLSPSTAKINEYHLSRWLGWMAEHGEKFSKSTPTEMIEYQATAQNREAYALLDLIQLYVNGVEGRHGYKAKVYSSLRSFFTHNRVQLPADRQYAVHSETPKATGSLKVEEIRRVILSSKGAYRAAFLSMLMGGMDLAGWESWSLTGWQELKAALDRGDQVHTMEMPGRKKQRNVRPYKTRIGKDALAALREYVAAGRPQGDAIFYDQHGRPLTKNSLQLYWRRRLIALGYMKLRRNKDPGNRYGKNLHELRDSFRTLWSLSGAAPHVAEAMMGHIGPDPYGYDKSADDPKFALEQFRKAEPWLNVLSSGRAFGQVDEGRVEQLERENEKLKQQLEGQQQDQAKAQAQVLDLLKAFQGRLEAMEKAQASKQA